MIKKTFFLSIAVLTAFSMTSTGYIMKMNKNLITSGDVNVTSENIKEEKKKYKDDYLDSVIFFDVKRFSRQDKISGARKVAFVADNVSSYKKRLKAEKTRRNALSEKQKKNHYYRGRGYCVFLNDVNILASNAFSNLECKLKIRRDDGVKGYARVKVFTGLYPDYERKELIALPVYVNAGEKQYPSVGVIMNANQTSLNVADFVDTKKIQILLAKSFLVGSDITYKQAQKYLNAVESSNKEESVTYQTSNNQTVPIVITNYQKPEIKDYVTTGIVEFTSALASLFGKEYLYNLTPLFKVNAGKVVYADLVFKDDEVAIEKKYETLMKNTYDTIKQNNKRWIKNKNSLDFNVQIKRPEINKK